ncbi:MAG TPA: DUF1697 domain-containing protein [Acidimicrobiales bacterium]|nr:DUF1697 domain-containing protein [Acidimicrobiales bacterium]
MSRRPSVYVALLRGVNVGGNNAMPMADLRALFGELGLVDARTYIQSGNVIFSSPTWPDASTLETAIEERFAIKTNVVLRSAGDLGAAVEHNPFSLEEEAGLHVGFMARTVSKEKIAALDHERFGLDRFAVVGSEVYYFLPLGIGRSKLPSYVVRALEVPVTTRNWNTLNKLVELTTS